jgi:hypothetical protein
LGLPLGSASNLLNEQAFVAHAGHIAARNANVGQLFVRTTFLSRASATARSLRDGFGPPASRIRSARSRSRLRILREFRGESATQSSQFRSVREPLSFLRHDAMLRASVQCLPTLRSVSFRLHWPESSGETDRRQWQERIALPRRGPQRANRRFGGHIVRRRTYDGRKLTISFAGSMFSARRSANVIPRCLRIGSGADAQSPRRVAAATLSRAGYVLDDARGASVSRVERLASNRRNAPVPISLPFNLDIPIATFGVVTFSVVIQGLTMPLLMKRLNASRRV